MKTNTINLKCFVVPNPISFMSDYKEGANWAEYIRDYNRNIGIEIDDDYDALVEVWVHSVGNDSNTDHGWDETQLEALGLPVDAEGTAYKHDAYGRIHAPSHLPYKAVAGVIEGETRTFVSPNGCNVNITFEQLPYRYGRFGKFEDVVTELMARSDR